MRASAPLVGRHDQLQRLLAVVQGTDEVGGSAALIVAEAGAGKTRLVAEALDRSSVATVHVRGSELGAPLPFVAMRRALRGRLGDDERIVDLLDDYRSGGSTLARAELIDAFADVLERMTFDDPLVVVVDDAHWIDSASAAVLELLARQLASAPLRLVVAARPHPRPEGITALTRALHRSGRLVRIGLPRLATEDARRITAAVLGGPTGPGVHRLVDRAGGNALYCTELGIALRDQVIRDDQGRLDITDPDQVVDLDVIEHNLASLDEGCRQLLADAALFGTTIDANELALLVDLTVSDIIERLADALDAGVLAEDDQGLLSFRHDLVRDAVVTARPRAVVGARHRDIVHALDDAGLPATTWAGHLVLADWTGHPEAWGLFERAAKRIAEHSLAEAADLLDHAARHLDGDPPVSFVGLQLERLLEAGRHAGVGEIATWLRRHRHRVLDAPSDKIDLLALRALEAKWWYRARHDVEDIVSWFQQLQPAISRGTADILALDESLNDMFLRRDATAVQRVEGLARRAAARGDTRLEATARYMGAYGVLLTSDTASAIEAFVDSIETQLATQQGEERPAMLVYQLATLVFTVRADEAVTRPLLQRIARVAEQVGPPASIVLSLVRARVLLLDGDWTEALQRLDEFVEWDRDHGFPNLCVTTRATTVVVAYAAVGRLGAARHVLDQARIAVERMHDVEIRLHRSTHHRDRALVEYLSGGDPNPDLDTAFDHRLAARLDRVCDRELPVYVSLAALCARPDLVEDYSECVRGSRHLDDASATFLDVLTGRDRSQAAIVGRAALARHDFLSAVAVAEAADGDTAVELLRASLERATRCGATAWAQRCTEALAARGETVESAVVAEAPTDGVAALTPAERRVLPLILDGLLYREIAEELHNSRRTIESHAASIMRKLGVSSRRELGDVVAPGDLVSS